MIASPDLLAFSDTAGSARLGHSLPEEHWLPLLAPSQPWSSSAQFRRDFILVAEFSEQVGPRPVLTIPDDSELVGTFDLNHFSVRLMSVDYQAAGPGPGPPPAPGPRLSFSEDSEVILGDSGRDAFAYVHHLTLHDLEARGMVRPFCMAYVSSDQSKLLENFGELSAGFSRAAEILKTGNRQSFSGELQSRLQQLQCARMALQAAPRPTDADSLQLEALQRSISTHQELLRQVTSYPNRKLQRPDFLPYDPADAAWFPPAEETPAPSAEPHLKSLEELCNSYFLSLTRSQLADTERRLRGDRTALHAARVTRWLSRKLPLTNFLFELWRPEEESEEEEEESEEARGAADGGEDALCSCVEELAIRLEPAAPLTSDLCSQMTASVSSSDSIEVLATERSYRAQRVDGLGKATAAAAEAPRRRPARADSQDSIEVLSTTESICPEDLSAISEEDTPTQGVPRELQSQEETVDDPRPVDRRSTSDEPLLLDPGGECSVQNQWSLPAQLQSGDEASDCTGSDRPTRGGGWGSRRRRKAGLRALRFLKENSFSQKVVFCLLSGRALVVLGTDPGRVQKLVEALSLFLPAPGPDRGAVMSGLTSPLQLSHLLTCRLIGIQRPAPGSAPSLLASLTRLGRYLALLDLDHGTLRCPSYSGSLVGGLADPRTSIRRGATYLLHLESGLTALSNRALLYTFVRRHGDGDEAPQSGGDASVMRFLSELLVLRLGGRGPPLLRFSYAAAQLHRNSLPT
ncbi:guanine nucleotide exchange protein smcr8b [Synchiropus splendidus]|uniref:guanine nucleotide exchange protein smcr8b n=1 Tax=Synchiropus splendidus TaxID=270530 RepID=UPI00237ECBC4|nr:guanine nucleotide exchange protein smcr8b [Synchiropus splendidus]